MELWKKMGVFENGVYIQIAQCNKITHPLKKYKRGGGTLPNLYFLRVSS